MDKGNLNKWDMVTLGESMVVFAPTERGTLEIVTEFRRGMAGAEGNVSVGLARLGHQVLWMSRLGKDGFGRFLLKTMRGEGVDVSRVKVDPDRSTGVYFKEYGADGQVRVQYYRSGSAASALSPADVDLTGVQASYLFVTGITPALSDSCDQAVRAAMAQARMQGMQVVFDPNVRYKLWGSPKRAAEVMSELGSMADIVLPGLDEGKLMTGYTEVTEMATALLRGRTRLVVIKLGSEGAYYQTVEGGDRIQGFSVQQVDEVGAGDAFAAGLLSGLIEGLLIPEAVRRACALGAMAVTVVGDYEGLPDREYLEQFVKGGYSLAR